MLIARVQLTFADAQILIACVQMSIASARLPIAGATLLIARVILPIAAVQMPIARARVGLSQRLGANVAHAATGAAARVVVAAVNLSGVARGAHLFEERERLFAQLFREVNP